MFVLLCEERIVTPHRLYKQAQRSKYVKKHFLLNFISLYIHCCPILTVIRGSSDILFLLDAN